jgi:hypothetical protein
MTPRGYEPQTVPGVVEIRLSGMPADVAAMAALIKRAAREAGVAVGAGSRPRPNREDPGVRVYLTVCTPPEAES